MPDSMADVNCCSQRKRRKGSALHKTMNLKGFVLLLGVALTVFLVLHLMLRSSLDEKAEKERELQVALTTLEERNKALTGQLDRVGTSDFIVSSAIRDYSFMNRNDIRFEYDHPEALQAYSESEFAILMDEIYSYSEGELSSLLAERIR